MAQFRIKEPFVDAIKVKDVIAQGRGDKPLEPAWLLNAYNDGAIRITDDAVELRGIRALDGYLMCAPNDGPGELGVLPAEAFEATYVPASDEAKDLIAPEGEARKPPSQLGRHAEIGQVLLNIGNRLKDERPDDGRPLLDFGAELIRDASA